uniref:OB domain-containing protein n=1 Tax=Graphocephala atropunctata TaxID=36148 RepID=A0A1B6M0V7_9HEMI
MNLGNNLDTVHIKDIRPGLKNFSITFIVLDVGQPVPLKENREVRTLKVADSTACINLSLWDEPGAAISPGDIIRLNKAYAGVWRSALTLYSGKNGDIDKVSEFCLVFNEQLNMSEPNANFANTTGNQPGSGLGANVNNSLNNGNSNNIGALQNRTATPLSVPQSGVDRKNTSRYSADREREPAMPSNKHPGKTGPRGGGRGGQRNIIRNEKR